MVDAKQWPALQPGERDGDMSNIVRFVHNLGLKAGIYTDAGEAGCGFYAPDLGPPMPHTGAEGHYDQDFLRFAEWGFDYVKVDWCGGNKENLDPFVQYAAIAHAINRADRITGHLLYYSICNWGHNSPWTWAPGIGGVGADIWRTSGDIVAPIVADSQNNSRVASFEGMLSNFDKAIHPEAQHTGFYNDPDMMVVGMPGLSEAENRVHMSLWAISGAPLMVGADLTKLSQRTTSTLTNPDVLSIDQDSLGLQAVNVGEPGPGLQVWSKLLAASGVRAVLLLNRNSAPAEIEVRWGDVGLDSSSNTTVKDAWSGRSWDHTLLIIPPQFPRGTRFSCWFTAGRQRRLATKLLLPLVNGVKMQRRRRASFAPAAAELPPAGRNRSQSPPFSDTTSSKSIIRIPMKYLGWYHFEWTVESLL